jgi:hypothetical protein
MVYKSNEPYSRETSNDGFWNGAAWGGGIGTAAVGAVHGSMAVANIAGQKLVQSSMGKQLANANANNVPSRGMSAGRTLAKYGGLAGRVPGWGKAAVYGTGAVHGALLGGIADHKNWGQ